MYANSTESASHPNQASQPSQSSPKPHAGDHQQRVALPVFEEDNLPIIDERDASEQQNVPDETSRDQASQETEVTETGDASQTRSSEDENNRRMFM